MINEADDFLRMLSDLIGQRQGTAQQAMKDLTGSPGANPSDLTKVFREATAEVRELTKLQREVKSLVRDEVNERKRAARDAAQANRAAQSEQRRNAARDLATTRSNIRELEAADRRKNRAAQRRLTDFIFDDDGNPIGLKIGTAPGAGGRGGAGGVGSGRAGGRGKGLGRLPLASVPATLMGNTSAGARVGYALGGLTGLGMMGGLPGLAIGATAAATIGAGAAASPIGIGVITKPLEILGATIGTLVLPSMVRFGAKILDLADWIERTISPKRLPGDNQPRLGKLVDQSVEGVLTGGAGGPATANQRLNAIFEENRRRMAAGQLPMKKEESDRFLGLQPGRGESRLPGEEFSVKSFGRSKNLDMLLRSMMGALVPGKMGSNILDIARETQQAAFKDPLEVELMRKQLLALENIDRNTTP